MRAPLRLIAVHVEEPATGAFSWVLTERASGEVWSEIQRSDTAAPTYKQAMADGLLALQGLVEDLDTGPRRPAQRTSAPQPIEDDHDEMHNQPPPRRSLFGFGPAT